MTYDTIITTLAQVHATALGYPIAFQIDPVRGGWLLQASAFLPDNTGRAEARQVCQAGGKYYISQHATHHELVLKCWQAVQAFVIHELREGFFYRGAALFQPHVDVDALAAFQTSHSPVYRAPMDCVPS